MKPTWLTTMVRNRTTFFGTVCYQSGVARPLPLKMFMPLVMMQLPVAAVWIELRRTGPVWSAAAGGQNLATDVAVANGCKLYSFDAMRFTTDHLFSDDIDIWVIEDVSFLTGSVVAVPDDPVTFRSFTRHMVTEAIPRQRAPGNRPVRPEVAKLLLDEFPWLQPEDMAVTDDEGEGNLEEPRPAPARVELAEDEYQAAQQEIDDTRAEWWWDDTDKFFYVRQRGGLSNVERGLEAVNCAAMFARKDVATRFANNYRFPKMKSFHYAKYTIAGANQLAREWARVGHYLACLWMAEDCREDYVFDDNAIDGLERSFEFLEYAASLDIDDAAFEKANDILAWRPARPPAAE